jgi:hypothetical protein
MYAKKLLEEGAHDPVAPATLEQIEQAVLRLDGKARTLVTIHGGDRQDTYIGVGGGADGKYVVYIGYANERFFTLLDPDAPPGKVSMVTGGQRGEFEARKCAARPAMLQAVRTFAMTGERDAALRWSRT